MLVTFRTDAHAGITMHGDIAKLMLKKMGQSGTIPGAIMAEDVPVALDRLTDTIDTDKDLDTEAKNNAWDYDCVSLHIRTSPLIKLLQAATKEHCYVSWEQARATEPGITI